MFKYKTIHEAAKSNANIAMKTFIEEHGEPFYCGMAFVKLVGNTKNNIDIKELTKLGIAKKDYSFGYIITDCFDVRTQNLDCQDIGVAAYINTLVANSIDCAFPRSRAL